MRALAWAGVLVSILVVVVLAIGGVSPEPVTSPAGSTPTATAPKPPAVPSP